MANEANWPVVGGEYEHRTAATAVKVLAIEGGEVSARYVHRSGVEGGMMLPLTPTVFRKFFLPEDQSPIPALTKALQHVKREWQHNVPSDCYSTGPCTGDIVQDHLACPGCAVQRVIDAALALVEAK